MPVKSFERPREGSISLLEVSSSYMMELDGVYTIDIAAVLLACGMYRELGVAQCLHDSLRVPLRENLLTQHDFYSPKAGFSGRHDAA